MGLVFVNGAVFDGHRYRPGVSVAVRSGRIVAVGEDLTDLAGSRVDLAGGLLSPGFVDAHIHPVQGGLERQRCDLSAASGRPAYTGARFRRTPRRIPASSGSSVAAGTNPTSPAVRRPRPSSTLSYPTGRRSW